MRDGYEDPVEDALRLLLEVTDDAEFFQQLGLLLLRRVSMDAAKAAYDLSLRLDPCDPFTHLYIGNWHYQRREYADAIERFEYAAELRPDMAVSFWCMANVFERQGRADEADEYYRRAVAAEPKNRVARRKLRDWRRRRVAAALEDTALEEE